MSDKIKLTVIGGGPGGYAAAFLAADLGMDVTLIDLYSMLQNLFTKQKKQRIGELNSAHQRLISTNSVILKIEL